MRHIPYAVKLRRANYGRRFDSEKYSTDCILVALDLLVPLHWTGEKEDKDLNVVRKLVGANGVWHITHSHSDNGYTGRASFLLRNKERSFEGLLCHGLILHECTEVFHGVNRSIFTVTARGLSRLRELLAVHDEMHIGDTLQLRAGEYRHFKNDDRYRVHWVSRHAETDRLDVCYEPLYGEERGKKFHRPLEDFTKVIYRRECGDHLGHRFWSWSV